MKQIKNSLTTPNSGIFTAFKCPVWQYAFPDSAELDTYFFLRYGDRIGNKLLAFYEDDSGIVTGDKLLALAAMIYDINMRKWEHLFGVYNAEYNPIENTDFIETITETNGNTRIIDTDTGNTRTVDDDQTSSSSVTSTAQTTNSGSSSGANNRFGFNSSSAVGDTTSSGTTSGQTNASTSTTSTGSNTDDQTIRDSGTEDSTITDNGNRTSEHRKHGNIGVTENVTMLEHEVEFWKWSFIDQVCKDICDIIALSIY